MKLDEIFSVKGKVAFVTGGSRGIGEMIASAYLANGAKVYISARKADACDAKAIELSEKYSAECISIPGDGSTMEGIEKLVEELAAYESKLDTLEMEQADPKAQDHVAGNRVMDLLKELEVARKERNTDPMEAAPKGESADIDSSENTKAVIGG